MRYWSLLHLLCLLFCSAGQANAQGTCQKSAPEIASLDTVGIISGSVQGTYSRFVQDITDVLENECTFRVIGILGRGSVQNLADLRWMKGIDIAIVQEDVLSAFVISDFRDSAEIRKKTSYLMKLYDEEIHFLVKRGVRSFKDLDGRRVSVGVKGSGSAATSRLIFKALDIRPEEINMPDSRSLDALRRDEVVAAVFVSGKPTSLFKEITEGEDITFLSVPFDSKNDILSRYKLVSMTHEDYPNIIEKGRSIETISVSSVLAVYNWQDKGVRFEVTRKFSERLLDNLHNLKNSEIYHPKWSEVNPELEVQDWQRFEPFKAYLRKRGQ